MSYQLSFTELVNYDAGEPSITIPIILTVGQTQVNCTEQMTLGLVDYEGKLYLGRY